MNSMLTKALATEEPGEPTALPFVAASSASGHDTPAIRRCRLGRQLRQLRQDSALRLEDAAATIDVAPSTLSRIETGQAPARTSYVQILLDLYGVSDPQQRRHLTDLAREGQRKDLPANLRDLLPAATRQYLGLEAAASEICCFADQVVPDLLQTRGYAESVLRVTRPGVLVNEIRDLVGLTIRRQERIRRNGTRLRTILDEAALLRPVGNAQVMADQIGHLAALASGDNMDVQVMPLTDPWPVLGSPFTLLAFSDPRDYAAALWASPGGQPVLSTHPSETKSVGTTFTSLSHAAMSTTASGLLLRQLTARVR